MASDSLPTPTPGAKMMFLIRRREGVSREELIAHWFANHMPGVIAAQEAAAAAGRARAWRYWATVFQPPEGDDPGAGEDWDGVAQLWWDEPLPRPRTPFGSRPRDSFQEKAQPYLPWATVEYVMLDGSEQLPAQPLTLNAPFPTTRSGFCKVVYLVAAREGTDFEAFYRYWLTEHARDVRDAMAGAGGIRYVVSLSLDPQGEPYAGMSELYFPDRSAWLRCRDELSVDDMEQWRDRERSHQYLATTEMIGIP